MITYTWGEESELTREDIRQAVHNFISNELDNGPGWVVTTNRGDAYDILVTVKLLKKPRQEV